MTFQEIVDSKHASSLLSFFLVSPNRTFAPAELRRRLRIKKPGLAKALRQLEELKLIKSVSVGRGAHYLINLKHPQLLELRRGVAAQQRKYQDELFEAIKSLGRVQAAYLSGLFVGHPELPVDLLIVGKINLKKLSKFLAACKKTMHRDLNYSVMTPQEFKLRKDTFDRFIKDIFDYDHVVVVDKTKS